MTPASKPQFLHIQPVGGLKLKRVDRWPGCAMAVTTRLCLALIGGALAAASIAYDQQALSLDMGADTIHAAGIIGGILCAASLTLPSKWCRKLGEAFLG